MNDGIEICTYTNDMSDSACEMDRLCLQGEEIRMSFLRPYFHARAECYDEYKITVAREAGRVVSTMAVAMKKVSISGTQCQAGFIFDLRTHPDYRKRRLAFDVIRESLEDAERSGAELLYSYSMKENRLTWEKICGKFDWAPFGGYSYIVWPVYRLHGRVSGAGSKISAEEAHASMLSSSGPFDLYSSPFEGGRLKGYVSSWAVKGGACSAWSNDQILKEVIDSIPKKYEIAKNVLDRWPLKYLKHPYLPKRGDALKSWYLFDFHADTPKAAKELMKVVNNQAFNAGVQYCYLIHTSRFKWVEAIRGLQPRFFSTAIDYLLMARPVTVEIGRFNNPYVDIRDI